MNDCVHFCLEIFKSISPIQETRQTYSANAVMYLLVCAVWRNVRIILCLISPMQFATLENTVRIIFEAIRIALIATIDRIYGS